MQRRGKRKCLAIIIEKRFLIKPIQSPFRFYDRADHQTDFNETFDGVSFNGFENGY